MNEKLIEEARMIADSQSNLKHQMIVVHTIRELCNRLEGYDALRTEYESMANRAIFNNDFKERLAQAIEKMPFGDTAASFAAFVREFK